MTREIQVMAWCDVDMAEGNRVPMAATHEVTLDGKAYTLDLCEAHEAEAFKPFASLLAHGSAPAPKGAKAVKVAQNRAQRALVTTSTGVKTGRPLGRPERALPLGVRCPDPDCGRAFDGRTQGALAQHVGLSHGWNITERHGAVCAVCGHEAADAHGLGNHVSKAHPDVAPEGFSGLLAGWWWASAHGDPHGVIQASGLLPFLVDAPGPG